MYYMLHIYVKFTIDVCEKLLIHKHGMKNIKKKIIFKNIYFSHYISTAMISLSLNFVRWSFQVALHVA